MKRSIRYPQTPLSVLETVPASKARPWISCSMSGVARRQHHNQKRPTSSGLNNPADSHRRSVHRNPRPRRQHRQYPTLRPNGQLTPRFGSRWNSGTWTHSRRRTACTRIRCGTPGACTTSMFRWCGRRASNSASTCTANPQWIPSRRLLPQSLQSLPHHGTEVCSAEALPHPSRAHDRRRREA